MLKKMLLETEDRASWIFQIHDEDTGVVHEDPSGRAHNDRETASRALTKFCDEHPEFRGQVCETVALTRDEQDAIISKMERLSKVADAARVADSASAEVLSNPPPPVVFTEVEVREGETPLEALERHEAEVAAKAKESNPS